MTGEITVETFFYDPILPKDANIQKDVETDLYSFRTPHLDALESLYQKTGFSETPQGKERKTIAVRGSTAALLSNEGALTFRHRKSDVDMFSVTDYANRLGAGYFIYHIHIPGERLPRELDLLFFTPSRLEMEQSSRFRSFFSTKLIQPGWSFDSPEEYDRLKIGAMATFILRGVAKKCIHKITPSGAARLVIEEDLYAEPWRWTSMKTYFVESDESDRQKRQLLYYANKALALFVKEGIADVKHDSHYLEPVYEIARTEHVYTPHPRFNRIRASLSFVFDQLSILAFSRQGLSFDNAVRVLMKWRSFMMNPTMSYDADIIFKK